MFVGEYRDCGGASGGVGAGERQVVERVEQHAPARRGFLHLGDQGGGGRTAQRRREGARWQRLARPLLQRRQRHRRSSLRHLVALMGQNAGQEGRFSHWGTHFQPWFNAKTRFQVLGFRFQAKRIGTRCMRPNCKVPANLVQVAKPEESHAKPQSRKAGRISLD